jgi:hypothetical protein
MMDCYLIRKVRKVRKAEISQSRRQPRAQPPTDIIREMARVDSEGKAEGVLVDSLPWWVSRILGGLNEDLRAKGFQQPRNWNFTTTTLRVYIEDSTRFRTNWSTYGYATLRRRY